MLESINTSTVTETTAEAAAATVSDAIRLLSRTETYWNGGINDTLKRTLIERIAALFCLAIVIITSIIGYYNNLHYYRYTYICIYIYIYIYIYI